MSKKKKRKICSIEREWSKNKSCVPDVEDLLYPLRAIVYEGYSLQRLPITNFHYIGYNIGEADRWIHPTPKERFCTRWLENDTKFNRTLIDNVLTVSFQFGVEYGRRISYEENYDRLILHDIVISRTKEIARLRERLRFYEGTPNEELPLKTENTDLIIDDWLIDDAEEDEEAHL